MTCVKRRQFLAGAVGWPIVLVGIGKAVAAGPISSIVYDMRITKFKFMPAMLEVRLGDKVRWTNDHLSPHTASAKDKSWNTKGIRKGQSKTVEVTDDMVAEYFCAYHPAMGATLMLRMG
jgi:plastocyanin